MIMTKREQKLIFDNEEFKQFCKLKYGIDFVEYLTSKNSDEEFIYNNPFLLFLPLKQFITEKFKVNFQFDEPTNQLSIYIYQSYAIKKILCYKTEITGLLTAYEWLIKEAKNG